MAPVLKTYSQSVDTYISNKVASVMYDHCFNESKATCLLQLNALFAFLAEGICSCFKTPCTIIAREKQP